MVAVLDWIAEGPGFEPWIGHLSRVGNWVCYRINIVGGHGSVALDGMDEFMYLGSMHCSDAYPHPDMGSLQSICSMLYVTWGNQHRGIRYQY